MDYLEPIIKTLHGFVLNFISHIPHLIIAFCFIFVTHYSVRLCVYLLGRSLGRTWIRPNLVLVLQKLTAIFIWLLGILIIFAIIFPSVTPANILATLGLTSVAIGFAFKDIFENFLAGILILLREPFHVGDYIETKNEEGQVEHISVRNTHLRRTDGVRIVVPNALLFNDPIRVLTDLEFRREQVVIGVSYKHELNKVHETIKTAIEKCESISKEKGKEVQIFVKALSSNGIDVELTWWSHSKPGDLRSSRDEVLCMVKLAFESEKIEIPHSYTLNFEEPLTIQQVNDEAKSNKPEEVNREGR